MIIGEDRRVVDGRYLRPQDRGSVSVQTYVGAYVGGYVLFWGRLTGLAVEPALDRFYFLFDLRFSPVEGLFELL
jgi:hypothetical protein